MVCSDKVYEFGWVASDGSGCVVCVDLREGSIPNTKTDDLIEKTGLLKSMRGKSPIWVECCISVFMHT